MDPTDIFEPAPDYGTGIARRRIRLTGRAGAVQAELEDHAHGMRCLIEHDGVRVTAVTPEFLRIPMTTCGGAGEPLSEIVGFPVGCDFRTFFAQGRARLNCTHMFDLAWLGVAHAVRGHTVRDYEIEVPDAVAGRCQARLFRDGELVLQWSLENSVIQNPSDIAGQHLFRGFSRWVLARYSGDELEAMLVLQKGCFIAQARRFNIASGPLSEVEQKMHAGLCYGFGTDRIAQASRLEDRTRDFTNARDKLLKFL